jgi:hypothetical protein
VSVEWRVTYTIDPPIQIEPADRAVPALNMELHYNADGLLKGATHTVTAADSDGDPDGALETSRLDLLTYWEALRYNAAAQLKIRLSHACTKDGHQVRQMHHTMKPEPPGIARAPDAGRLAGAPPGLATWLWLANAAEHERDQASALRTYYVILEGIHHGRPGAPLEDIGYARDFVSHGQITGKKAKAFLAPRLGDAAEYRYDPHNRQHRILVAQYRLLAQRAVVQELSKYV